MRKNTTPAPLKLVALGKAIERRRVAKHWSKAKLAERSSLSVKTITRIERGHGVLRILAVVKIAKALGTTTSEIMRKARL